MEIQTKTDKKTLITAILLGIFLITTIISSGIALNNHKRSEDKLQARHLRDSLIIDTMKAQLNVGGWYELQWDQYTEGGNK